MTKATQSCSPTEVLDLGFVKLEQFVGGDAQVVNSARISFARKIEVVSPQLLAVDRQLINYLMVHQHGTPFEPSVFTFHVKAPIFVAREWFRHRIASYNEISGRYTILKRQFYVPRGKAVRVQVGKPGDYSLQKIGSLSQRQKIAAMISQQCNDAFEVYEELLDEGIAREVARMVLPVNTYTEFYFTVNARSLMNFLQQRNAPSALLEIREYAIVLEKFFKAKMPVTHKAFVESGRQAP